MDGYVSGADYDAQFAARYEADIRYLTALAKRTGGPILDVCCGTGIVTIPLAELGFETVGIDISEGMLSHAASKAAHLDKLSWLQEDALAFHLGRQFALALMTGNAFQQFLTRDKIRTLLRNVYAHLREGGTFVFDTRLLDGADLSTGADYELWDTYTDAASREVTEYIKQRFDPTRQVLTYDFKQVYPDGSELYSQEELRFSTLEEIEDMLQKTGFAVVQRYQDWEYAPFETGGSYVVFELSKGSSG